MRSKLLRVAAAGMLLAVVAGCNGSGSPAPTTTGARAQATPESSAPAGVPVNGSQTPESVSAALAALPADIRARIPQFAPAPTPHKVKLPEGDAAVNFQRIETRQRIAFITIDDGWVKNPLAMKMFQAANVPVTLFLEVDAVKPKPSYFTELQSAGAVIEAHTLTHPNMTHLSYEGQKRQICESADQLGKMYGRRPELFRPPFGSFNGNTLRAVKECGLKASFTWKETTDKGIIRYQDGRRHIAGGDIILMHFRDSFVDDFLAILTQLKKDNLTPVLLENYLP
ncbi:polysaccharide deacetylase family protein [Actinoplanes sp. NPDC020271]|uniref:polysaccharide deacetylase family protein n=1 Tax=Actinoplanes sp. NPDC020271 TaxID=3363896 RepID=UPI003790E977